MEKQVVYEVRTNPLLGNIVQLICLLLIVRIAFHFDVNPLGATISITLLALIILLKTNSRIIITDNSIEIQAVRTFSWLSSKYVANFKDIETVDYDKPGRFLPGYILGASSAMVSKKKEV